MGKTDPLPRIFISYARRDGQEFANSLRRKLEDLDFSVWQDISAMEGGRNWWGQISEAIKQVEYLVMVMTPGALESKYTAMEWKLARQEGACVLPVFGSGEVDMNRLPRWMRDKHFVNTGIPEQWKRFVRTIEGPCQIPRVPFMAEDLPEDFVQRSAELEEAIHKLLTQDRAKPVAITALYGSGGFGKTTLARATCHDPRIIEAFDDGVLWVTLGEAPGELTSRVEELIYMLSGERPGFTTLNAATARFRELLEGRDLLIVIDDVWDSSHLRPFMQGGPRCARLITTRNSDTLPGGSANLRLDAMNPGEALDLLTWSLDLPQAVKLKEGFVKLAGELGEWPLLLKLVNGVLRTRIGDLGQSAARALEDVGQALAERGLTAFDKKKPEERDQAVATTLDVSLYLLDEPERRRYEDLAVFPEDTDVPLATVQKLWAATGGLRSFETEELCVKLAGLSLLLKLDLTGQYVRLHDVFRKYLIGIQGERLALLHSVLLDAHHPVPINGAEGGEGVGWPDLPADEPYMWDHLAYHLGEAGRPQELVENAKDLRYLTAKTHAMNALAVEEDLLKAQACERDDQVLAALHRSFVQCGHLLTRLDNVNDIGATLHSRMRHSDALRAIAKKLAIRLTRPYVTSRWPPPDLPNPRLVRTLAGHTGLVYACAISADGSRIVSASSDSTLKVWETDTGVEIKTLQSYDDWEKIRRGCAISADGTRIISASPDNTWDLQKGFDETVSSQMGCAISADGSRIVSASSDNTLTVWDAQTGAELKTLRGHTSSVIGCAISADGSRIVSESHDRNDNRALEVWDAQTGAEIKTLHIHRGSERGCAISADGTAIVSASSDNTLKVWDAESGAEIRTLEGHTGPVIGCAISTDGSRIVSASDDKTLKVWDTETGGELKTLQGHTTSCATSADGSRIVFTSSHYVKLWDAETGPEIKTLQGHTGSVSDCAISANGTRIVSAAFDHTLKVWDAETGPEIGTLQGHNGSVRGCAVSADGTRIVSASWDSTLKVWDARSGDVLRTLQGHASLVNACAISADGTRVVSASGDESLKLWDAKSGAVLKTLLGHHRVVSGCAISADGTIIVSASYDNALRIWDAKTGADLKTLQGHTASVYACAISADATRIISASADKTVKVWDAGTGAELKTLQGHTSWVMGCAISVDGTRIVSASEDRTLKIWDAITGAHLKTLRRHSDHVTGCAISADGARVASTSEDNTLKLWDAQTGDCLASIAVDGPLNACAISPDGINLVAVGDGGVYFLELVT
jgi:WD40 repeat protein